MYSILVVGAGKEGKGFQRINIACPRAYLRQALNQLKNALEEIEY